MDELVRRAESMGAMYSYGAKARAATKGGTEGNGGHAGHTAARADARVGYVPRDAAHKAPLPYQTCGSGGALGHPRSPGSETSELLPPTGTLESSPAVLVNYGALALADSFQHSRYAQILDVRSRRM